jgi:putative Holliday junction resolvase
MGLPKNMDGSEGPRAQSARSLSQNILQRRDIPLALWDERLSSAGVERALLEGDASRARRDEVIDKLAAAWILQGAIDRLHNPA